MLRVLVRPAALRNGDRFPGMLLEGQKTDDLLDRALDEGRSRVERSAPHQRAHRTRIRRFRRGASAASCSAFAICAARFDELLQQQEQHINQMAIDAIRAAAAKHIVQLRLNARFELAKLYDKLAAKE